MCGHEAAGSYDLHNHSVFSDGSCSVGELIDQARAVGLAGMAVTDHDSLTQLSAVRSQARAAGFSVLAGVEVSAACSVTGRKVHILGFGLEATRDGSGPLERLVAPTLNARAANTLWQAWTIVRTLRGGADPREALALAGVADAELCDPSFSLDALERVCSDGTAPYKQHIMEALTHLPYTDPSYQRIYRSIFKGSGIAVRDIGYPEATDAVRAIREQGGVPVLAHPAQMDSWSLVPELVDAGLLGIEVYHPDHGPDDEERSRGLASEYGLFMTGGSDYHGRNGAPSGVGVRCIAPDEAGDVVAELFEREAGLG